MHPDRCFDAEPSVRRVARELYEGTQGLPIVSPHGHVDARVLATNEPFENPTALLVTPDHYVLRMLYARGVSLESLGVRAIPGESAPRAAWGVFARHYHVFRGTPTGLWLEHELHELFEFRERLAEESADRAYDCIAEKLASPEFRPRPLFERFQIEVLATTDAASDSLEHHQAIRDSGWSGRVIPTFRPDALFRLTSPKWEAAVDALASASGMEINGVEQLLRAVRERRAHFRSMGATATDHGVIEPYAEWCGFMSDRELETLYRLGRDGRATEVDEHRWSGFLLAEMAQMSVDDGLVMQLHAGALRDHNRPFFAEYGSDRGGDIPVATEFTRNLRPLLNQFGNDSRFTVILYTLDESTYSRELAPLAGHYPAVRLGAPWWFHDSVEGMTRFLDRTTETAGIDKLAGFVDDTRAFCSIPARHDVARRVQANWLARQVSRHLIDLADARDLARALAYDLAKSSYRL
jgi:glucuronate isomerase